MIYVSEEAISLRKIYWGLVVVFMFFLLITAGCIFKSQEKKSQDKENGEDAAEDAIELMLQEMTIEQKVGQLIMAYFDGPEFGADLAAAMRELHLGGVILFSSTGNIENPAQVAALTADIQNAALKSGGIPLFIAADQEGGIVARFREGVTVFPGNMALGAAGSEDLARLTAAVLACELRTMGVNLNFAPVVDVNNNPDNPVIGVRSFGSDPALVSRLGAAMVAPYREAGVLATAKHFPGHGDTAVDSHYGLPQIDHDWARLSSVELPPFQAMVDARVPAVMVGHILMPALTGSAELPASLSPQAISYLREEMGFEGLILSDSMSMGAITENWGLEEACVKAIQAGIDMIVFGPWSGVEAGDRGRIFRALKGAVEQGTISPERLDQAVKRILCAKKEYGILDDPLPQADSLSELAAAKHLEVARRVARESVTLVRDRGGVIPLDPAGTVPLIWPAEQEEALAPLLDECPFLQPQLLPLGASGAETAALFEALRSAPLVLAGSYNLRSYPAWVELINALEAETDVVLLAMASPYDILAVPGATACLAAYSDCRASVQALAGILRGALEPRGSLPVTIPGL
jgi:beta-N-acetylhexosaminidase